MSRSLLKGLRSCLDVAIPDSGKIEFESDKVNYILSSIFFLANRISKASIGLAEFDKVVNKTKETSEVGIEKAQNTELKELINEIIAKYF